jgi:hypothetical protein
MVIVMRWVILASLMFWLGGFTFYTAIVVPLGTEQIGGAEQGFITREVTQRINIAAAIALCLLLVERFLTAEPSRVRWYARWALWLVLVGCQVGLFVLHGWLDSYLEVQTHHIRQRPTFYQWHRVYLWLHTVQWLLALVDVGLLLAGWRAADRRVSREAQ